MRILIWSELFWPHVGGAEVAMAELGPALQARGHEVFVITSHDHLQLPDRAEHRGVPVYRLPMRQALRSGDPAAVSAARREAAELRRSLNAEVTLLSGADATALLELQTREAQPSPQLTRLNRTPLTSHTGSQTSLLARVLDASDWVVAVSACVLEQTRERYPGIAERSSVLYTGLARPELEPAPLPSQPPLLLCLGRLIPGKGFDLALEAFAALGDKAIPGLRLLIAGDGPERGALEARAVELGVAERVDFSGWIAPPAVPALLNRASLVLLPSRSEGLPNVAVQAAWMGRPIVCTDAGGLPEVVLDGETGLVVPIDAGDAFASALSRLLREPATAAEMGHAARRHAEGRFDWKNCVDTYEERLQALLQ